MDKQKILQFAQELVSIQSVSTDEKRFPEILKAADYLRKKLESMGFTVKLVQKDKTPPLIFAKKIISENAKTIAIYGHYDVQPEDPVEDWRSSPFELTVRDGKMYARGIADNKGHVVENISAIESLIDENKLDNNIVFIFEGEEELGSVHFEEYVDEIKDELKKVDVFYITDSGMYEKNVPQIEYALRGLVSYEMEIFMGEQDIHSGQFGNRVINPINVAADLISQIKSVKTGKILIPGFYEKVRTIDEHERSLLKKIYRTDEQDAKEAKAYGAITQDPDNPTLSSKIYPSFDVHGIIGGYTQPGSKNIVPKSVLFKFSFRLVENQKIEEVDKLVRNFIKEKMPKQVKYTIKSQGDTGPFYTSIDNEYVKKSAQIMSEVFQNETVYNRSGGTIGASEVLQRFFGKPIILTGFVLADCGMHSPNENFDEEMFWKGIEALKKIYAEI